MAKNNNNKQLFIKEDGHTWVIPLEFIANHYAQYYCDDENYKEMFDFIMEDYTEAKDWFLNDMDWKDVEKVAILVEKIEKIKPEFKDYTKIYVK